MVHYSAVRHVLILRHGTSTWNLERRWQGWIDAPLAAEGEEQAGARARELAREGVLPRAIYCSDLARAHRTAEILAAHLECPVVPDEGFRERHGGDWQGHTREEIDARWPGMRDAWRRGELASPPGGETDEHAASRFDDALARALAHVGNGLLVVVTHHGVLRLVASRAGADVHTLIPNLGGFWFDADHGALSDPEPVGPLEPTEDERPPVE
jgi:probable phosphoglycerate mutase